MNKDYIEKLWELIDNNDMGKILKEMNSKGGRIDGFSK